jgi:hypothetical protein
VPGGSRLHRIRQQADPPACMPECVWGCNDCTNCCLAWCASAGQCPEAWDLPQVTSCTLPPPVAPATVAARAWQGSCQPQTVRHACLHVLLLPTAEPPLSQPPAPPAATGVGLQPAQVGGGQQGTLPEGTGGPWGPAPGGAAGPQLHRVSAPSDARAALVTPWYTILPVVCLRYHLLAWLCRCSLVWLVSCLHYTLSGLMMLARCSMPTPRTACWGCSRHGLESTVWFL